MHPALHPGSPPPADDEDVEVVLRAVPELAFFPELEPCIRAGEVTGPWPPGREAFAGRDFEDLRTQALRGLEALADRAERERSGGLAFLVRTLTYFLVGPAALPAVEHPLLVALLLRGAARGHEGADTALEIARAMDRWG
ncbi:hypothetical protein SAMN02745121_04538 [Nannocystis exedens]|uniref:Uncharacterized protein n=1 Tax=Nannocystis exedens TaxID=54 RepID=A0A1I2B963_9BACT|nr:hypothetical protein [Nannocystis exedens]PCC68117.1 hypothetical protein NAEX_01126 [Nannocystis exedens]SFE52626.1 hypothetical protein SAMN02745121_04538 [Nannocystis exedens]